MPSNKPYPHLQHRLFTHVKLMAVIINISLGMQHRSILKFSFQSQLILIQKFSSYVFHKVFFCSGSRLSALFKTYSTYLCLIGISAMLLKQTESDNTTYFGRSTLKHWSIGECDLLKTPNNSGKQKNLGSKFKIHTQAMTVKITRNHMLHIRDYSYRSHIAQNC